MAQVAEQHPVLPPEQQASYSAIIDSILASSDLNTISAKTIRKGLQARVDYDLTPQKTEITSLIMDRFDRFQRDHPAPAPPPAPTTNGVSHDKPAESSSPSNKRKAAEEDSKSDFSDIDTSPPPKKVKKAPKAETDEEMAKRMQAELNQQTGTRATRGGGTQKKKPSAKKDKKKPKKKSAAKIRSDDDSDVDGSASDKPEKEKKGGFHKLMNLSPPLQALLGEPQLSRPQTVKRIWAYVKEHDLQQPDDKRNIMCDDLLRAVFKCEKVHMFTMNKILATQLYPADE